MSLSNFWTAYFDSLSDKATRFDFNQEIDFKLFEERFINQYKGKLYFAASILQIGSANPANQTRKTRDGHYLIAKVRPLDVHNFIIPHPCDFIDPAAIRRNVDLHPEAYSTTKSTKNLAVGSIVNCYFDEQSPEHEGKLRGLRFEMNSIGDASARYDYRCLKKAGRMSAVSSWAGAGSKSTMAATLKKSSIDPLSQQYGPVTDDMNASDYNCEMFPHKSWNYKKKKFVFHKRGYCRPVGDKSTGGVGTGDHRPGASNFNFVKHQPNPQTSNIYRSARPLNDPRLFEFLREEYGIERVMTVDALNDKKFGDLTGVVAAAGLEHYAGKDFELGSDPPDDASWQKMRDVLSKGNVLVHCTHGADRTGAIIARWQVEEYNQNADAMYKEALQFGFKRPTHKGYYFATGSDGKPDYNKPLKPDPNKALRNWIKAARYLGGQ